MADVKETLLTAEGLKKLEEELAYYKSVRRIEVSERIKTAIEYGDISENSEYDDAKNEQAFIEADPFNNRISNESPVGKAILGKRKGDEVEVSTPDGPVTFKVLAIQ
ncbi:MAG: GreA/GreB family elongation factor [Veillonella sp.]|nr:GreA/GreB family elongation factor [Veillonella sp.]